VKVRQSVRVLLLDPDDRVLLVRVEDGSIVDPANPVPPVFWVTIGGGVKEGETDADALGREVFEETGIREFQLGPQLWQRDKVMDWRGEVVHVYERYYAGHVPRSDVVFDNLEPEEQTVFRGYRWWSAAEILADHNETILPPQLPRLLAAATGG
jgi:8-oxo-dGTP pyrophosphatase MutT (NUDIX family)